MVKKILLIYPEIPVTYWSLKYAIDFVGKKGFAPPLGLLTVAAMLPEEYEVKLVDMNISRLKAKDISSSDIVFISAMIVQKKSFDEVVRLCNKSGTPVIAGGPYPTSSYRMIEGVDHFVLNEAEKTLPVFLEDLKSGKPKKIYSGKTRPDIKQTPIPRFDLADMNKYNTVGLQFSRGCPFNCEFCDITEMLGGKTRTKLPEQFIQEIESVYRTGFRGSVFIVDDNFIGNKKNVKKLLPAITKWQEERRYPFGLFTQASLDLAQDEKLMDMMVKAGFDTVFLGIETPVEESLMFTKKNQNVKSDMLKSIIKIQNKGIEVMGGFIIGFDNDPENIFNLQIDFIQKAGVPSAMVGLLLALPNTQLYRRLKSENRIIEDSSGNNTHDMRINFIPKMNMGKLLSGYKYLISEVYKPEMYFKRCLTLLQRLPANKFSHGSFTWKYTRAFILSLVKQPFSFYGFKYLKFLFKSIFVNPGYFSYTIRLAIMGHHYFTITREILVADNFKSHLEKMIKILRNKVEGITVTNFEDTLRQIHIYRDVIIAEVQREYSRLHKDFRMFVEDSMDYFLDNTGKIISEWTNHWYAKANT